MYLFSAAGIEQGISFLFAKEFPFSLPKHSLEAGGGIVQVIRSVWF